MPINFFMYDSDGNIIRWNDELIQSTGYDEESIAYLDPIDYFPEDQQDRIQGKIKEVFDSGEASIEAEMLTKQGEKIPYFFTASLFEDDGEKYMIGVGQNISQLKEYEQKILHSLKEKEVLLSEIHHRVKNNLAIISGLLQLESFQAEEESLRQTLRKSQMRIQSMAAIHEILYQEQDLNSLPFADFVSEVIASIRPTNGKQNDSIEFQTHIDPIRLNINQAIPCGLILNELITNAYDYAYPDGDGSILVAVQKYDQNVTLRVKDNGIGIQDEELIEQPSTTGFTLVQTLVQELEADIDVETTNGIDIQIMFTKEEKKGSGSSMQINSHS